MHTKTIMLGAIMSVKNQKRNTGPVMLTGSVHLTSYGNKRQKSAAGFEWKQTN